jgi:hypothetical protein
MAQKSLFFLQNPARTIDDSWGKELVSHTLMKLNKNMLLPKFKWPFNKSGNN